jgi:site-specific recombinase XerD
MMRSMVGGVLTQKRSDRLDAGVRELLVQRELAEARFPMIKPISPLRQRMIDDMTMRNLSPSTQETYIRAVAQFSTFHRRSPDKLGVEHLRDYHLHLVSRGLTANSIWVKMGALRFFYRTTLRRPDIAEQIPMHWLFPGRNPSRPMTKRSLQLACRRAAEAAGLSKSVTVHTLRHSFATHLLEQGVDIRVIQDLLGHRHIKSTAGYARVAIDMIRQVQSPLELLNMAATTPE